jgi:KUP system potassium uptake protein
MAVLMLCWREGSLEVRRRLYDMSMLPLDRFLTYVDDLVIGRTPGLGVWLTKVEHGASPMLIRHLEHNRVFHERVALLSYVFERRPRVPFGERHKVERIGHGFYRVQVRLGFMQTPDIPRTLENIQILGFDSEVVRREKDSAMGPISFAIFSFLSKISSRAPDYFKIPHDGVIEVGFRIEI